MTGEPIGLPVVTARRGGIKYGEAHVPCKPEFTPPPPPEGAGGGHWRFGVIDADGEAYWSHGIWESARETFSSPEEALEVWGHVDGARVIRQWHLDPLPWEVHS